MLKIILFLLRYFHGHYSQIMAMEMTLSQDIDIKISKIIHTDKENHRSQFILPATLPVSTI